MTIVNVNLWGKQIGVLAYGDGETNVATFEYLNEFIDTAQSLSPLYVPNTRAIHSFSDISERTFHGLPGFIADSLPDKFGSQLIEQYFANKGISKESITPLDRLLYVGDRSMGGLEYTPATIQSNTSTGATLDLQNLSELAELVISNKTKFANKLHDKNKDQALALLKIGSSAGGARAKALVAMDKNGKLYDGTVVQEIDCKYYLLKFDTDKNSDRDSSDPKGMTKVEYIYSLIANDCGINMPDTTFLTSNNNEDFHFLIERFDRVKEKNGIKKLHYVSWSGMAHAHRDAVGAYSYSQLVLTARELGLKQGSISEIFKRAVFNIVGRNQDDHTKNFGFLMNKAGEWSLSPAFDLTYSYDPTGRWTKVHQIKLNEKQDNFTRTDIIEFAKVCNIKEKKANEILDATILNFKKFSKYADEYKVSDDLKETVAFNLRLDF